MREKTADFREILSKLSNPLEDRELIKAILLDKIKRTKLTKIGELKSNKSNIRTLDVPGTRNANDGIGCYTVEELALVRADLTQFILKKYIQFLKTDRSRIKLVDNKEPSTTDLESLKRIINASPFDVKAMLGVFEKYRFIQYYSGCTKGTKDKIDQFCQKNGISGKTDQERTENFKLFFMRKYGISENAYEILKKAYESTNIEAEHIDSVLFVTEKNKVDHKHFISMTERKKRKVRFYLNTPQDKSVLQFASEYIKECIEEGIDYDSKFAFDGGNVKPRTILYSESRDVSARIRILEKIKRNNPDLIRRFGSAPRHCARINDSYYGISHVGITKANGDNTQTYNDYVDGVVDVAFVVLKARLLFERALFDKKGLKPGDLKFLGDIAFFRNIDSQFGNPSRRQSVKLTRYLGQTYKEGEENKQQNEELWGKGLNWIEIEQRLDEISKANPQFMKRIQYKINEGSIDPVKEFRSTIQYVSNFAQGRELKADSNLAINSAMERICLLNPNNKTPEL